MSSHVRDMRLDDIPAVAAIEAASFRDPWSAGAFREELGAPHRAYFVADEAGAVLGYAGVMLVDDDAHLMNVAVDSARRGEGLGRALTT